MGEGNVDLHAYFQRFAELCPNVPVHIETISGFNREISYLTTDYWKAWPNARAQDFVEFLALANRARRAERSRFRTDQTAKPPSRPIKRRNSSGV